MEVVYSYIIGQVWHFDIESTVEDGPVINAPSLLSAKITESTNEYLSNLIHNHPRDEGIHLIESLAQTYHL